MWICFNSCGEGAIWQLAMKTDGRTRDEAFGLLENYDREQSAKLTDDDVVFALREPEAANVTYPEWAGILRGHYDTPAWWFDRGFNGADWERWFLSTLDDGAVVIPYLNSRNEHLGDILRNPEGINPKYKYSPGMPASRFLFGENRPLRVETVVVVEGSLDAIWVDKMGIPAVALLGSTMSEQQAKRLSVLTGPETVPVLMLDNDTAGQEGFPKALDRLRPYFGTVKIVQWTGGFKDPQEVRNGQVLIDLVSKAKTELELI